MPTLSETASRPVQIPDAIPDQWEWRILTDICRPKQWPTLNKTEMDGGVFPVYGANGLIGWHSSFTHAEATLTVTCRGATCGTINVIPPMAYITGNSMALDSIDAQKATLHFLAHALEYRGLSDVVGGSAQPQITGTNLRAIHIPLPPLAEQRKIAAILSSVDGAIQATEAVIAQTRRVKEGLLQELLTKGIGHTRFKKTAIGEIPEAWEVKRIRDLGDVTAGKARNPNGPGVTRQYLRCANVFEDRIDVREVFEMPFTDDEFERYLLRDGDILLNEGQSLNLVGRPAVFRGEHPSCAFQNSLVRLRVDNKVATPEFAYQLVRHLYQTGGLSAVATQTTSIAHLGVSRFANIKVSIPPVEEQRSLQEPLSDLDELNRRASSNLEQMRHLKSGLLQDLLTGKVRVSP